MPLDVDRLTERLGLLDKLFGLLDPGARFNGHRHL
ncbi:MAG: hypothetical protein RL043_810 [Pseudomonadota bacterium]